MRFNRNCCSVKARAALAARGFSLVELITVMGIIAILLALLLPSLQHARRNAVSAQSQSNMRQIFVYMHSYSSDNREYIVPSRFDYSEASYQGLVRTQSPAGQAVPVTTADDAPIGDGESQGTWSDILWTTQNLGPIVVDGRAYDYRYDSPDTFAYDNSPDLETIFRSPASVSPNRNPACVAEGKPGFYAANNFFDSRPGIGQWWTTGQIRRPEQSMYLVDSVIGEVIESVPVTDGPSPAFLASVNPAVPTTMEVDFRYVGEKCNFLMLGGSISSQSPWDDLAQLENNRKIRVTQLNLR